MRVIPGYQGKYFATRDGRIWSTARGGMWRKVNTNSAYGHQKVALWDDDTKEHVHEWVHRVVLKAWVGPCPPGHWCRHLNSVASDNRLENLEWATPSVNQRDKTHGISAEQVREIKALERSGRLPAKELAERYGVPVSTIYNIRNGCAWSWVV